MLPSPAAEARTLWDAVACPWCGADASDAAQAGACVRCRRAVRREANVLAWSAPDGTERDTARHIWKTALRQLNPVASRLSPLRYFADWRVEQYYRRTLTDAALAREWGAHYLRGLELQPHDPVLDHGCGRGRNTALMTQLGLRVGAQDRAAHAWWQTLGQSVFQQVPSAAPRLPWKDGSFALVLDTLVIHYLSVEQVMSFAREVFRVLSAGSHWVLVEANDRSYGAHAVRRIVGGLHPLATVRRIVSEAGFTEVDLAYEGFYAPVFPTFVNYVRKIARPAPLDLNDYRSSLAARIPAHRRALWCLRLMKPQTNG